MPIETGTIVRLIGDSMRAGQVLAGEEIAAGTKMRQVHFFDGPTTYVPEANLEPVPEAPPDLLDLFSDGRFAPPEWLRRALTRIRVTGRRNDMFYSMEATEPETTDFYAYQFKPVLKLLDSPTDALLIADEVGLGKTIEAGLIWTELRARLECNRLLVICPKILCEKWRIELDQRFGVDARIVDAQELLSLLKERGRARRGFAAITSMQGIRPPKNWDSEEEDEKPGSGQSYRRELARYLEDEEEGEPLFDLLVVDEAHHMRNPKRLIHDLGRLANGASAHRVFLSATPIHLRSRDLHSLLRLIDSETFEHESTLDEMIEANEPVIGARDLLMRQDSTREQIAARLDEAKQNTLLSHSRVLRLIRDDLDKGALDEAKRATLASRLETVNQLANYINRTRRRDVELHRVIRYAEAPTFDMSVDEELFYTTVTQAVTEYARENSINQGFLLSTALRMLTSSFAAASEYWSNYNPKDRFDPNDDEHDFDSDETNNGKLVAVLKELACELDMTEELKTVDTKFKQLHEFLDRVSQIDPAGKVIIF